MGTFKTTEEFAGASELLKRNVMALIDQGFILKVEFEDLDEDDPDKTLIRVYLDKNPNVIIE